MQRLKYLIIILVTVAVGFFMIAVSHADTLTFDFEVILSGDIPGGTSPYLTATFDDATADAGYDVRLTMSAINLVPNTESVEQWYFNLNPSLDPTMLSFNAVDVSASDPENGLGQNGIFTNNPSTSSDNAQFKADGDGVYDILFDFPPPQGNFSSRFTDDEIVIYDIAYSGGTITASSFNFFSEDSISGGQGNFLAAAHIQNTAGIQGSGWVAVVPEPISAILFVTGGATLAFRRFTKKK